MRVFETVKTLWSATRFNKPEVAKYAEGLMLNSTRNGIVILSTCSLLLQLSALALYWTLGSSAQYFYTHFMLSVLSVHILTSSYFVQDLRVLNMLGIVLLVVTAMAFMLLAHATGSLSIGMMASMVLLFMAMPLVPWGMREAISVIGIIYLLFTASALSVSGKFDTSTLLTLQFFVIAAAAIATILVARNVYIRKHDISARYDLESAHRQMEILSYRDPLTGAWNRRFLDSNFSRIADDIIAADEELTLVLFDIDDFKYLNDSHGHDVGDLALQRLVIALNDYSGEQSFVIRLGGDEFALLTSAPDSEESVTKAIDGLHKEAAKQGLVPLANMGVSFGLAKASTTETAILERLYKIADLELYESKRRRRVNHAKMSRRMEQTTVNIGA